MGDLRLYLFRPHGFNVQLATWSARLEDLSTLSTEGSRFLLAGVAGADEPEWLVVPAPARVARFLEALAARPEAERAALDAEMGASLSTPAGWSRLGAAGRVSPLP